MQCSVSQSAIAQAVTAVQNAVPTRPSLPILSSILVQVSDDKITLSATDLYFGVQCSLEAAVTEPGICAVPGKQFVELLKSLPAGKIELSSKNQTLHITAPHIKTTIQFLPGDEFPVFPDESGFKTEVPADLLRNIVSQAAIACSPDLHW